jgi:hypothetical protein
MSKIPTQKERILAYLKEGKKLTRLNAWDELGVLEAPARICELRAAGWDIETERITVRNRYDERAIIARWHLN